MEYAIVDGSGAVINLIVADQDFIDSLPDLIADENVDSGILEPTMKYYRVDDLEEKPSVGWTRSGENWIAPVVPEPVAPLDEVTE